MTIRRTRRVLSVIALALAATVAIAWGFWTALGVGNAAAGTGSLTAATITAPASGVNSVTVTWSQQASLVPTSGANSSITYSVERKLGAGAYAAITSGGCSGATAYGTTSCLDTPPATGSYSYRVVASYHNWTATSSEAGPVSMTVDNPDFLQPITSPELVRAGPAGIATGDIDNDGDQDIVTSAIFSSTASVLVNNGVGGFRENTVLANAATIDVGLGKFDNDSNPDLVLLYQGTPPGTGLVIIFKGGGDGTFTYMAAANEIATTGVRSTQLTVGNFNGDAIDDVAVVNSQNTPDTTSGTIMTFLGNPAGNDAFTSASPTQTLTAQLGTTDVAFADFNGGAKDLVATNYASNSISLFSGNGAGFGAASNIATGASLNFFDTAFMDAGSNRDIVAGVRNSSPSAVRTLFGNGAGAFPTQTTTSASASAAAGANSQGIVASDLDADGDIDVALDNGVSPTTMSTLTNDGAGGLTIAPSSPETNLGGTGSLPYGITSADFDGNGYKDLAVSPVFTSPGELRILLNQKGNAANLSVTQTDSPDPVPGGGNLTYTLTAANASASTPSSVKVTDKLPTGTTFNAGASSSSCSAAGSAPVVVTCDYGAVATGSPESLQVVVAAPAGPATLSNTATVAGNLADPTPADNTSTATTTVSDVAGPTGGSVDASGLVGTGARYKTSTALSTVLNKGSDPSGLAASGAKLKRATATLTSTGGANGVCGTYGASAQIGADDPNSPVADTVPAGQACYRYEYIVSDTVGNSTTYTSPDIKVDTTAPAAPTGAFSAMTNMYWSGSTLFYRSNASSGGVTVTASATDANSGIVSYSFPTLPAGWTSTPGALGVMSYSWSAPNPTAPSGAQNVTATNNATLVSPATGITMTSDVTAPATGSVTYTDGYRTSASVSVSFVAGSDAGGSGVNATSGLLQRAGATLTGGTCGSYGAFATVTGGTNPTSPFTDATVAAGNCYQYRYLMSDNVGNQATYTSANVAKIDTAAPTIARAVAAKTDGSATPGTIRQGGDYYLYAQVSDDQSLSTVTANASSFDTGVTAASLSATGGPWTVGGLSYNYRSATLTANTALTTGNGYSYTITAIDAATNTAGPTAYTATIETYSSLINGTAGLVSYWRFNDGAISGDEFTDTTGTLLSSHTGAVGATWVSAAGQARTAVITNANRLRKETGNGAAQYYTSTVPASANYVVSADVYVASLLATDATGVIGRMDTSGTSDTFYVARYMVDTARWELNKVVGGVITLIGTGTGTGYYSQTLTAGSSYRVSLQMNGTTISLLVDGVSRIVATDSAISAVGRGGVRSGITTTTAAVSDTAGLQFDNFRISSLTTTAADSRGANTGTYTNGPVLNVAGALAGDSDRSAQLDGTNDYVTVPDANSLDVGDGPFTLEAWIKRSSVDTARLDIFAKGSGAYQFGLSSDNTFLGRSTIGTIMSSTTTVTGTAWHHLVVSKSGATTLMYIDGIDRTGTGTDQTLADTATALILGSKAGTSEFLAASIDEFAIYNSVLSGTAVLDHYKAGAGTG
jgi:uncharacterized repeat protein (TIGR01451 family)